MQERAVALREPVVRQDIAGALESVALEPPAELGDENSDFKSEISNRRSENVGKGPDEPETKIEPGVKMGDEAGARRTGLEAHPTVDSVPGMAGGSRLPPDLLRAIDTSMQEKFKRRTQDGRSEGVHYRGGTPQSEEAVERALHWLAAHQRQDGSWNFNHLSEACQHYCTHPGSEASTTAATGLALLPFLGAGYTHKQGEFQHAVQIGLDYLKSRGARISYGNDLRDGSMYGQPWPRSPCARPTA